MKRHRTDLIALLFGIAFATIGGAFLWHELTDNNLDPAWIWGSLLLGLGVVALGVTVGRRTQHEPAPAIEERPDA